MMRAGLHCLSRLYSCFDDLGKVGDIASLTKAHHPMTNRHSNISHLFFCRAQKKQKKKKERKT
jgi:hypothetical protein